MTKSILVLTCIVLAAIAQAWSYDVRPMVEKNLVKILLRSSESIANTSQRIDCFSIYMPLLSDAIDEYEKQHQICLQTAAKATDAIETEVASDRASVYTKSQEICSLFTKCSSEESSYNFFDCHNNAAGSAITTSSEIQTFSKTKMQFIELKMNVITYEETACTDKCSDDYVRESAMLYAQLEACLAM